MITVHLSKSSSGSYEINEDNQALLDDAIWIDLLQPTRKEELFLEQRLALNIPTREEMREIELSSRLYKNKGALFMTATMIAESSSPNPKHDAVTFVLAKQQLITIRYIEPQSFRLFLSQIHRTDFVSKQNSLLLIELLEVTIDRLADILESIGHQLEDTSKTIFRPEQESQGVHKLDYQLLIQQIGVNADLNTNARESLVTFNRLITFFAQSAEAQIENEEKLRLGTLSKDVSALSDHANFISSKVNFLLDATLGLINIEQNSIIKIFSVAAVIFLPPTLIASIYGMNFHFMPELSYKWGYFMAVGLMFLSALLPYKYFKRKKWL